MMFSGSYDMWSSCWGSLWLESRGRRLLSGFRDLMNWCLCMSLNWCLCMSLSWSFVLLGGTCERKFVMSSLLMVRTSLRIFLIGDRMVHGLLFLLLLNILVLVLTIWHEAQRTVVRVCHRSIPKVKAVVDRVNAQWPMVLFGNAWQVVLVRAPVVHREG